MNVNLKQYRQMNNQLLLKLLKCKYIYIGDTLLTGAGIFASKKFPKGSIIVCDEDGDYYDEVFTRLQLEQADVDISHEAFQIGEDTFLLPNGNIDDLINHSCNPNSGIMLTALGYRHIALRDINANEQITYDYSTYMFDDSESFSCKCGESSCRNTIQSFCNLKEDIKSHYLRERVVAPELLDV